MTRKALVLLNMGGPNNLHEVEVFLTNMFNDEHILSIASKRIRKLVAGIITTLRVEKAQEIYRELGGKSPLVDNTNTLIEALNEALGARYLIVAAMRYTPPYACDAIKTIMDQGIRDITLFPLYPQHSTTTTASSVEDFVLAMDKLHCDAKLTVIPSFYEHKALNEGIVESIQTTLGAHVPADIDLIFSAHGLPQKIVDKGDLYQQHVEAQVQLLKSMLREAGLLFNSVSLAYQSKVGPMKWLEPSLEQSLAHLKPNKQVLIYPIAFMIDNSETVYELHVEYREVAHEMGYHYYEVVPALNHHPKLIQTIRELIHA